MIPVSQFLRASGLLLFVLLAGCSHPATEVSRQEQALATSYRTEVVRQSALTSRQIAWDDARARMLEHNPELTRTRNQATAARERQRQVVKDLLPGAALTGSFSKAVTDLGQLNQADGALSLYAFLNLPGLVQWHLRHYGASLEVMRADYARELKERELTLALRELFLRSELLAQRRRHLALAERWRDARPLTASLTVEPAGLARESAQWALDREGDEIESALANLLGDAGSRWLPAEGTAPRLDYAVDVTELADTTRFGLLQRRLQAIELTGAALRERGVRLQSWPDLRFNLSSPPLYSTTGDRWSFDELFVTASTAVPIDLRGSIAQQARESRRDRAELETRLRQGAAHLIQQLRLAQAALAQNARRLRLVELRLEGLRSLSLPANPTQARENLEQLLALDEQRTGLVVERSRLEGLFWLLDEPRWDPPSAEPSRT